MADLDRLPEGFRLDDRFDAMAEWADDESPKRFRTPSGRLAEIEARAETLREACRGGKD